MFHAVHWSLGCLLSLLLVVGCPGAENAVSGAESPGEGTRETEMNTGEEDESSDAGTEEPPPATLLDGGTAPTPSECGPQTPGFGDPCAANPGDPLCGTYGCDYMTGELVCNDPGSNACGGCDELDTSAGALNDACGEHLCGRVYCNPELTATECRGDHPRNLCGGCDLSDFDTVENEDGEVIEVTGPAPGDACSTCLTGIQTCSRDQDELICWRGRSENNSCGTCERCVLYHAVMDQRLEGNYLRSGTIAIIEDIGDYKKQLVFDPLVEGPGANGLVMSRIYLSTTPDFDIGDYTYRTLSPAFSQSLSALTADPHRQFTVYNSINLDLYKYVVIYDQFFETVISIGELVPGAP